MAGPEAYHHAKFHLDPPNRLATINQRHRQTDRQTDRKQSDSIGANRFTNGRPKTKTITGMFGRSLVTGVDEKLIVI